MANSNKNSDVAKAKFVIMDTNPILAHRDTHDVLDATLEKRLSHLEDYSLSDLENYNEHSS